MYGVMHAAVVAVGLVALGGAAEATTIRAGFDSETLAPNDDGSTGLVSLGFTANFFGVTRDALFVNNNGNVTFDNSLGTFTPFNLNTTSSPIIAPFFADVDTRGAGNTPVTYGAGVVDGRSAFGVNWIDVGYFSQNIDKLNSFQLVIVDRSDIAAGDFDFEFNYGSMQWETGSASGGSGGLGGSSARVGFSNGTTEAGTFFELPGSAVNGAFVDGGPNALSDIGRLTFEVRNGVVAPPPVTPIPTPMAGPLLIVALGALGLMRVRNRSV